MSLEECTSFQFSSPFPSYLSYVGWENHGGETPWKSWNWAPGRIAAIG